jgi:hypothetical protein
MMVRWTLSILVTLAVCLPLSAQDYGSGIPSVIGGTSKLWVQSYEYNDCGNETGVPAASVSETFADNNDCDWGGPAGVTDGSEALRVWGVTGLPEVFNSSSAGGVLDFSGIAPLYIELDFHPVAPVTHWTGEFFAVTDSVGTKKYPRIGLSTLIGWIYFYCTALDILTYAYTNDVQYKIQIDVASQVSGGAIEFRVYTLGPTTLVDTENCTTTADNYVLGVKAGKLTSTTFKPKYYIDNLQFSQAALTP